MFTKVVLSLCPGPPEFWRGPIEFLIGRKPIHCGPPLYNCPPPKGSGKGVRTKRNKKSSSWSCILIWYHTQPVTNQLSHTRAPPYSCARSSPGSCCQSLQAFEPHLFNSWKSPAPQGYQYRNCCFFLDRKHMQLLERLIRWYYFIPIRSTQPFLKNSSYYTL